MNIKNSISFLEDIVIRPGKAMRYIVDNKKPKDALLIVFITISVAVLTDFIISDLSLILSDIRLLAQWVASSAILSFLASKIGGKGNFSKVLTAFGYAFIPSIIFGLISIPLYFIADEMSLNLLISITFLQLFWTLILEFIGLREAHQLSNKRALIVFSVVIFILIMVLGGLIKLS